jgi:hypothetical protein
LGTSALAGSTGWNPLLDGSPDAGARMSIT